MGIRTITAVITAVAALTLTACGSNSSDTAKATAVMPSSAGQPSVQTVATPSGAPGVLAPMGTGKGRSGLEALILSVEDRDTRYGRAVVVAFQIINNTPGPWDGAGWSTPTVVYGAAGMPAETFVSLSEGLGAGVQGTIPPNSRQTVQHAYKVTKAQLSPAVITAGSVVWQGDFSQFQR